jgi:DNA-binding response OmpR family regulator
MSKLVYLDDEPELTNIFNILFDQTFHEITVFNEETKAIDYCLKTPPDILFVDYRLGKMKGDEVALQLPDGIKKVLVTGDLNVDSSFEFDRVIKKPFRLSELLKVVDSLSC